MAGADVAAGVRRAGVVHVEKAVVRVVVVVTANVNARVRRVEVPVIARRSGHKTPTPRRQSRPVRGTIALRTGFWSPLIHAFFQKMRV